MESEVCEGVGRWCEGQGYTYVKVWEGGRVFEGTKC